MDDDIATEASASQSVSGGNWLESLLTAGTNAYAAVQQAKSSREIEKYKAAADIPSVAQPPASNSLLSGNTKYLVIGGAVLVGVVLLVALRRK